MKNKVRIQKVFILLFMCFAVFNYNNCELSSEKGGSNDPVDETLDNNQGGGDNGGNSPIVGRDPGEEGDTKELDDSVFDAGDDEGSGSAGSVELTSAEKYDLLLEAYTDSYLHSTLVTNCGGCHKPDGYAEGYGVHGASDIETSLQDLLYYNYNQGKVDLEERDKSLLYTKVLSGHQGGESTATDILNNGINPWLDDYEVLAAAALEAKEQAVENGEVVSEEEDVELSSEAWRTVEDLNIFSTVVSLPTSESSIGLTIESVGTISIDIDFDSDSGYYLLKNPVVVTDSGGGVYINELRILLNEEFNIKYGTWSSIAATFNSGEKIGNGVFFIEAKNPGSDTLQLGFVELSMQ